MELPGIEPDEKPCSLRKYAHESAQERTTPIDGVDCSLNQRVHANALRVTSLLPSPEMLRGRHFRDSLIQAEWHTWVSTVN